MSMETATTPDKGPENVYRFLSRSGFLDTVSNEQQFQEWMNNLSFDDFQNHLVRLNGLVRQVKIKDRQVDGDNVAISSEFMGTSYLPPSPTDKDALLSQTFDNAKKLSQRDAGLLMYFSLQAIHPFVDGNGRTGRLLFLLLEQGAKGSPLDKDEVVRFLAHEGDSGPGRELFEKQIRPPEQVYRVVGSVLAQSVLGEDFLKDISRLYSGLQSGEIEEFENPQLNAETKATLKLIMSEAGTGNFAFKDIVLFKFLQQKGKLDAYATKDEGQKLLKMDGYKLLSEVSDEEGKELIQLFAATKRQFVEKLIDVIANPNEYKFADGKTVKDRIYLENA